MPLPRLIPCLDVAGGRVVKGVRFQGLADVGDPVELGALYSDAGADELVYLDVKATLDGRAALLRPRGANRRPAGDPVHRRRRRSLGRRRGGAAGSRRGQGLRQQRRPRPTRARERARGALGSQAVVVAIDADERRGALARRDRKRRDARPSSGRGRREGRGAGEILLTSIDADGTRDGYDLELTRAVSEAVSLPVIASGGAGTARHIADVLDVAQAALLASILHESPARLVTLRDELRELGVSLRDAA